jgi:anhydro-N-acetylmuramic acid kinase
VKIIGLMSGTSADGLDIALCEIHGAPPHLEAHVIAGCTVPYPPELRNEILCACDATCGNTPRISELHTRLGHVMAEQVIQALSHWQADADLIASHGQTIWHNVTDEGTVSSTLQIGSAAVLAERTGITVISDFRSRDVAAGGQGAPLTAYVDWLLLRHPTRTRAIQNIGGMGNVSVLPSLSDTNASLLAFDTGPGNVLIDHAVTMLTDGQHTYDRDGQLATQGRVHTGWLNELMQHPYYAQRPPKTTGRELFTQQLAADYIQQGRVYDLSDTDIIATLTALTAQTIAHALDTHVNQPVDDLIVGGGGSRNPVLMQHLRDVLAPVDVITHEAVGIDSDFKEALVFAVLAYESWHQRPGTLPSQTGADCATIAGSITPGTNYLALLRHTHFSTADDT